MRWSTRTWEALRTIVEVAGTPRFYPLGTHHAVCLSDHRMTIVDYRTEQNRDDSRNATRDIIPTAAVQLDVRGGVAILIAVGVPDGIGGITSWVVFSVPLANRAGLPMWLAANTVEMVQNTVRLLNGLTDEHPPQ